tara:strand:+ start:1809 stop:2009 length:201 start_codon:yes stop_codon:yes gene_type:complete
MQVGDKVIVSTSRGVGLFGKVVKFTEKRILVRTNFAPEENIKKHYGNKFPVSQYYRPEKVTRKEWK